MRVLGATFANASGISAAAWCSAGHQSISFGRVDHFHCSFGNITAILLIINQKIIDAFISEMRLDVRRSFLQLLLIYLMLSVCITITIALAQHGRWLVSHLFQTKLLGYLQKCIISKAMTLDAASFECPRFYDVLQRAQQEPPSVPTPFYRH